MANEVLLEKRNRIAYVTINRPEARNCLNHATRMGLAAAWEEIRDDKDIWIGIVQGVYPQDQLMDEATKLAETINANGPIVVQGTKEFIYNSLDMPLSMARKMEQVYYQRIRQSPDYDEGSAAFGQKRQPEFTGKPTGAQPKQ